MVKKLIAILSVSSLLLLSVGCVSLSLSDEWKEQRRSVIDRQMTESTGPIAFSSFAFLKENNPQLEHDIVCHELSTTTLPFVLESTLELPCMLVPTFTLDYGRMFYNGEEVISGESAIYCSYNQDALIRIEGVAEKNEYHFLSFVPYSELPVIEIVTDGQAAINSLNDWIDGIMITSGMEVFSDSYDTVRVRNMALSGSSPKLSFRIETKDNISVLGMKAGRTWCFLSNFEDRTQLRNSVAFELGRLADGLEWTPSSQFACVTINGRFQGLYQIAEQPGFGTSRMDVTGIYAESQNITGGYLIEVDNRYDELWRFHPQKTRWNVNIVSPTDDDCSYEKLLYVKAFWNDMENSLEKADYSTLCSDFMDMNSFIDYGFVQSLASNNGLSEQKSVFAYKKPDGKLFAGPVWDFEYYSFNNDSLPLFTEFLWYKYLKDDTDFHNDIKDRWERYRPKVEAGIYSYIDSMAGVISSGVQNGDRIYPYGIYRPSSQNNDDDMDFDDAVAGMKAFLKERIEWIDREIGAFK